MKYLYMCLALIMLFAATSCSKKGDAQPMPHSIKFTASGSAAFTAIVAVVRTTSTTSETLDTRSVAAGSSYDFSTQLNSGDAIHFELQTMTENLISYTITDNGAAVVQQSGKELGSFSKTSADYTVN